ncbi:MAG: hypothetical protein V3W14_06230 [Candidatus Neomarinimicrobiota bacterium]
MSDIKHSVETSQPVRHHFDRLLITYILLTFGILFAGSYYGVLYLLTAMLHVLMIFLILRLSNLPIVKPFYFWLRRLYPLLFLLPLYYEIELLASLFHSGAFFDPFISAIEKELFSVPPHKLLADILPGPVWREFFHLTYLINFPVLIGGIILAGRQEGESTGWAPVVPYPRYAFVMLGCFFSFLVIQFLFPVEGPLDDRYLRFEGQGILGPVIDFFSRIGPGRGGALPSSPVGLMVVTYLLWRPKRPAIRYGLMALILAGSISAVYGAFHYALDVVAGLIAGVLFYLLWEWLYRRLKLEPESAFNDDKLPHGRPVK